MDRIRAQGRAYPDWSYVDAPSRDAYRWMADQTARHTGQAPVDHPPLWAWHSCGGWGRAPDRLTFALLFGDAPQPHLDLQVATLEIPAERVLLSRYGPWCDMYQTHPFDPDHPARRRLFVPRRPRRKIWPPNDRDIQASFLCLKAEDVVSVTPAAEVFGA